VGYQAYVILKRQVVRPVRNSLWVRELLGIVFLKVYMDLRLSVQPIFEAQEIKWGR
jgi:hypothetical protein